MTAKEFVKEKHPKAIVQNFKTNNPFDKNGYWLCWEKRGGKRLSEGKSESNAWVNAKKYLVEEF